MTITNMGRGTIFSWEVCWSYNNGSERTGGWNAIVTGSSPWCASGMGWNDEIQPNESVEFGIQGMKTNPGSPEPVIISCEFN